MGYMMKEALKALCGVNQWSYAVFWKIGTQNPKLLIWEECYYKSSSSIDNLGVTMLKSENYNDATQLGDKVHLLVDRMMISNHVNVVGEGLVGRAAFTGNHQWIVSGIYNEIAHTAKVLNEVHLQFSAGMQTVAVIPVIPHGVVQLGSPITILENVGFVHDVRSLILQLACIPSTIISDNYVGKDASSLLEQPLVDITANPINLHGNRALMNSNDITVGSFNQQSNSSEIYKFSSQSSNCLLTQFQDNLQVSGSFTLPNLTQDSCNPIVNSNVNPNNLLAPVSSQGVVMPLKSNLVINQPTSITQGSGISCPQSSSNWALLKQLFGSNESHHVPFNQSNTVASKTDLDSGITSEPGNSFQNSARANMVAQGVDSSIKNKMSSTSLLTGVLNHGEFTNDSTLTARCIRGKQQENVDHQILENPARRQECKQSAGLNRLIRDVNCVRSQIPQSNNSLPEDYFGQTSAGDDLSDVLGVYFKNKLLNGNTNGLPTSYCATLNNQIKGLPKSVKLQNSGAEVFPDYEENSESGIFSSSASDHLLDAVISGVGSGTRQISDDDASCRTTVSKISSASVPSTPHTNLSLPGLFNMSDRMQGQLFGHSKPTVRLVEPIGSSVKSACGNNVDGSCTFGSQISSWIEQGPSTSISTANSKKSDGGKSNRKRLKPGENPRPRPKDRQMIQDRVKELREIVPNGAKCSIDALLERTIKHMLFLQSVTKYADKLKQNVESKIAKKEGEMLLKDEFQGSATWAFELGSQSLVCPIIVEDLNAPRQLLIEMLCEERGFFLEIADIIRGLGLTILKGVMEARNDKIWAHFAVEANRDVTRMEVFISLVHLLEQTLKSSPDLVDGTTDENMAALPASRPTSQQLVSPIICGEPNML